MSTRPLLAAIGKKTAKVNLALTFTVSASDKGGDALSYSASDLPSGAAFNSTTRVFSWTPASGQAGNYAAIFTVTDTGSVSDSETVTISCK